MDDFEAVLQPSTRLRVTVALGARTGDFALPGATPVAELIPELMGHFPTELPDGSAPSLVTTVGLGLAQEFGLREQGVADGDRLEIVVVGSVPPPMLYDEVAELVADLVGTGVEPTPWRRWGSSLGIGCLVVGGVGMQQEGSRVAATIGLAGLAALLMMSAILSSHRADDRWCVALPGWMAAACGALAAATFVAGDFPHRIAAVGSIVAVLGAVALIAMGDARLTLLPVTLVGLCFAASGWLLLTTGWPPGPVWVTILLGVALASLALPRLSLRLASIDPDPFAGNLKALDAVHVGGRIDLAEEILVTLTVSAGLLMALLAPLVTASSAWGAVLLVVVAALNVVQSRDRRGQLVVSASLWCCGIDLVILAASVIVLHPEWLSSVAVGSLPAGALMLGVSQGTGLGRVRRERLSDVVETGLLVALLPLSTMGTGLFELVHG